MAIEIIIIIAGRNNIKDPYLAWGGMVIKI